ncbi:Integral membrane protein OS=Tsukamurella paurometabola (strain ATCC 8368 / DSM / CCUG 35730/ CIP 100753 / JCM 10117 / KCTC 9821 / NBRC 16120 / NCIMB 702349/ NCTC 13040) OX=521096 GN=Tpau_1147 PE=4 SV=1 [Tsukamurella paurometabola]|uniref:Integral membrane protein n=1 Tax=Tsukamurella paurometabola (strain ATCC 8368 / DSM 20162 / CCUG 35730 / CIP 100753 / JCM 10117 / KCTC 9821 / NBRC 16120 / NCIMB 702349 / NCTC 13040) TaxID=521096 RepID=D5UVX1_TSUPD|nr:hypothetical protein [Tsukamurella paurometabola]ADG77778.1 conserved hypothetical protein [Tsukamurella paurometabola DSM 20162]SUP28720.1 Uncharacterised protein [Tsukamurella paurometabola]
MNRGLDALAYALAAFGGAVCAVGATMYLHLYIGSVPMPISAIGFGALLAGISVACGRLGGEARFAAIPVIAFLIVVVVFLLGGPGNSIMYTDWRLPLLLVCGIGMPVAAGYLASSER